MRIARLAHLVRRFVRSLDPRPPSRPDVLVARAVLSESEFALWSAMPSHDRRHALEVLRRFDRTMPGASRAERAAALLHDVGKLESSLGRLGRVVATVVGARGRRFRVYHEHEPLGAAMLSRVGSDARTVELVGGTVSDAASAALRRADDV